MKRILSFILSIVLGISLLIPVQAYTIDVSLSATSINPNEKITVTVSSPDLIGKFYVSLNNGATADTTAFWVDGKASFTVTAGTKDFTIVIGTSDVSNKNEELVDNSSVPVVSKVVTIKKTVTPTPEPTPTPTPSPSPTPTTKPETTPVTPSKPTEDTNNSKKEEETKPSTPSTITLSSDAFLKSLSVKDYKLEKTFDKNTYEYDVYVDSQEDITIEASTNHSKATLQGVGKKQLLQKKSTFDITVTAEDGTKKIYKLNVIVKDQSIHTIVYNGKNIEIISLDDLPFGNCVKKDVQYKDIVLPGFYSKQMDCTFVVGVDANQEEHYYVFDNNIIDEIIPFTFGGLQLFKYGKPTSNYDFLEYKQNIVEINDVMMDGYKYKNSNSNEIFLELYDESMTSHIYQYDSATKSLVQVDSLLNYMIKQKQEKQIYMSIAIGVSSLSVITYLIFKNKRKKERTLE